MTGKSNEGDYEAQNIRVENALCRAAVGYKVKLKKPAKVKEETNAAEEGKRVVEKMVTVEEEKYIEPKMEALMFWLKSRMPEKWGNGDKVLAEVEEMRPVLETYADVLDGPVAERKLEDAADDGQDPFFSAE